MVRSVRASQHRIVLLDSSSPLPFWHDASGQATKPEIWDDEMDGEWVAPKIINPEFVGEWKQRTIPNPAYGNAWSAMSVYNFFVFGIRESAFFSNRYVGNWSAPLVDNPAYVDDASAFSYKVGHVGFELWQVNPIPSIATGCR